jgi:signal transduction protein with GAF and PtsI domain
MRKKSKKIKVKPRKKANLTFSPELSFLALLSQKLSSEPPSESWDEILQLLGKCVEFSSASLLVFNKESKKLEPLASMGKKVDLIGFLDFDLGTGLSAWVAKGKKPVLLSNLKRSFDWENPIKSFVSVPLLWCEELVGILNLSHIKEEIFGERELKILEIISGQLAVNLAFLQADKEKQKLREELEQIQKYLAQSQNELKELEKNKEVSEKTVFLKEELNNPLAIISGNTQFLLSSLKEAPPALKKRLKAIDQEVTHIFKLTEKLSEMKSYQFKSNRPNPSPIFKSKLVK